MGIKNKLPILVSVSGGRTSMFMARYMQVNPKYHDRQLVYVFANTGKEREETLEFVQQCDEAWGLGIVWVEAVVHPDMGVGTTYRIVDFDTASRSGQPFEAMNRKYGTPNKDFPHCTRELKQRPINSFMKSLGFNDWESAIGIRADEPERLGEGNNDKKNPIYPMANDITVSEEFVRNWWDRQPFDLQLKDYEGNCDLCWKKSRRKRLTILLENPQIAEWWLQQELHSEYVFDRDGLTLGELMAMSKEPFRKAIDKQDLRQLNP